MVPLESLQAKIRYSGRWHWVLNVDYRMESSQTIHPRAFISSFRRSSVSGRLKTAFWISDFAFEMSRGTKCTNIAVFLESAAEGDSAGIQRLTSPLFRHIFDL